MTTEQKSSSPVQGNQTPELPFDPFFGSSDVEALFAKGVVVVENRIGESAPVQQPPQPFFTSMMQRFENTKNTFSSLHTQREFFSEVADSKQKFTHLCNSIVPNDKVSILTIIDKRWSKGDKLVSFEGTDFVLPTIKGEHIAEVLSGLSAYTSVLFDSIDANLGAKSFQIDRVATLQSLRSRTVRKADTLSHTAARAELFTELLAVLLLEDVAHNAQSAYVKYLKTHTVVTQSGALFLKLDSDSDSVDVRTKSFISPAAVSVPLSIVFSLRLGQFKDLIDYIFSKSLSIRVKSKISLLSSVKPEVRQDLVLAPLRSLERAMAEYYLSRPEVLNLVFTHEGHYRCPHCQTLVVVTDNTVAHVKCVVVSWLVDAFQFSYENNVLSAPRYAYVSPSVTTHAKELLKLDGQRRLHPYISKSEREFKVVNLDVGNNIKVSAQSGSIAVHMSELGSVHNLRSHSKR